MYTCIHQRDLHGLVLFRSIDCLPGEGGEHEAGGVQGGVVEPQQVEVGGGHLPHRRLHALPPPPAHQQPDLTCANTAVTMPLLVVLCSAPSVPQLVFTITEKAPTMAWFKAPTSAFTFKTLC